MTERPRRPVPRRAPRPPSALAGAVACALLCAAGCDKTITTDYAAVRGPSINGVSAFVQMLRDAGLPTTATSAIPAVDDRCTTLVVFGDRFGPMPADAAERLQAFLDADGAQTLVLALRDDDWTVGYWRAVSGRTDLTAAQRERVTERLSRAEKDLAAGIEEADPPDIDSFGYTLERVERANATAPLTVELKSAGVFTGDTIDARWELHRRLVPGVGARVQWRSGRDPLLVRIPRGVDEIVVVASATPLLNGGLVDPGNRSLAADLVARLPAGGRTHVVGSTDVASADGAGGEEPSILRLLAVQPHPWIAAQALAALALFCWWRAPIVGRPRREGAAVAQDFGHHVAALGSLLARARGEAFAERRLEEWRRIAAPTAARVRGTTVTSPSGT